MTSNRKKVTMLVLNEFLHDARVLKEAEALAKASFKVTIIALRTSRTKKTDFIFPNITVKRINSLWVLRRLLKGNHENNSTKTFPNKRKFKSIRRCLRLFEYGLNSIAILIQILASKPHYLHAHDINALPILWIGSLLTKSKLIYDAHEVSTSREGYKKYKKIIFFLERTLVTKCDLLITTTKLRARYFSLAYKIKPPELLQNKAKYSEHNHSDKLRKLLNLNHSWPIILYQGGLQPGRGLENVVKVAKNIDKAYFVFLGNGISQSYLMEMVKELNLSNRVIFNDMVPLHELPSYTACADIGLQPIENTCFNHYSTDSNKLFEYAMAGLPVIATDFPEIRQIIQSHKLGILTKPSSIDSLENAIKLLLSNKKLISLYKKNSVESRRALSWELESPKLINHYEALYQINQ